MIKLKIWHKMIIGISIPSIIAVAGGFFTYGYINDVKHRQGYVQIADDLKENVFEIRRNAKNYFLYKNNSQLVSLRNAISAFSALLAKIPQETDDETGMAGASLLKKPAAAYADLIEELNVHFRKEADITRKVSTEGQALENFVATKKLAKELSTSFVLRLRLLEKNHMLFRNEKSYRELSTVLSQISNVTPFCYECVPYIDTVNNLLAIYQQSDALIARIQTTGEKLQKITAHAAEMERQKINSFILRTQKLLLSALVLLCTIGPFFVYKTSSFIFAPVTRLAEITRKISEGEIHLRAPIKEQDETYSLAVSFNSMLDNLEKTQKSLKESLTLLNEKQAQLVESEKRASMGFLVAGVAHEINNPLNNISLRAEILQAEIKKLSDTRLNSYVEDIVSQSERAHEIVNNLLDFARARKSTRMEKQDIAGVVHDSIRLVANQLKVANIKLVRNITDRSCYVHGNRSKLEQILISIITNAIHAMKDGGTLTLSVEPDKDNKNISIKITDTGKGIPEEDLKNIFEPFYTTKPPGEGTGLGLAITQTLVAEHKGTIKVESKIGAGTAFTITLPAISH